MLKNFYGKINRSICLDQDWNVDTKYRDVNGTYKAIS